MKSVRIFSPKPGGPIPEGVMAVMVMGTSLATVSPNESVTVHVAMKAPAFE